MYKDININKIKLLIPFLLLVYTGCTSIPKDTKWYDSKESIKNWYDIEIGDIIIKNKTREFPEWVGHSGLVISPFTIGDYPMPLVGFQESHYVDFFNEDNREITVLRYKGFNKEFKEQFLKNIQESKELEYWVFTSKLNENLTYCSKYIWYLYYKTAKDLGYNLDLDVDAGVFVFPYDFIGHPDLENINLN